MAPIASSKCLKLPLGAMALRLQLREYASEINHWHLPKLGDKPNKHYIRIDGVTYEHDVVIDRGEVRKRKKKPSKKFRDAFGHAPLSVNEKIPWKCCRLIVGTGMGALPVMEEVKREAKRRKIELLVLPTARAIEILDVES